MRSKANRFEKLVAIERNDCWSFAIVAAFKRGEWVRERERERERRVKERTSKGAIEWHVQGQQSKRLFAKDTKSINKNEKGRLIPCRSIKQAPNLSSISAKDQGQWQTDRITLRNSRFVTSAFTLRLWRPITKLLPPIRQVPNIRWQSVWWSEWFLEWTPSCKSLV
jgi:hypothetical protein